MALSLLTPTSSRHNQAFSRHSSDVDYIKMHGYFFEVESIGNIAMF